MLQHELAMPVKTAAKSHPKWVWFMHVWGKRTLPVNSILK